jgi:hypothetical protein
MKFDLSRLAGLRREQDACRRGALAANQRVLEAIHARDEAEGRLRSARKDAAIGWGEGKARSTRELPFFEEQLKKAEADLAGARQDAVIAGERYDAAATLLGNCERFIKQEA